MLTDSHAAQFQDKDEIDFAFSRGRGPALDVQISRNTLLDREVTTRVKSSHFLVFRALLLITLITACFHFLYGQERGRVVPITRNVAWNDLVHQIDPSVDDPAHDTLGKEVILIQNFLWEHQSEVSVTDYDIAVFRAIDHVRARLQKADKDLEAIKNELSYKEQRVKLGR